MPRPTPARLPAADFPIDNADLKTPWQTGSVFSDPVSRQPGKFVPLSESPQPVHPATSVVRFALISIGMLTCYLALLEGSSASTLQTVDRQVDPPTDRQAADHSPTQPVSQLPLQQPRGEDGAGQVMITGELKTWHKITLTMQGPFAHEFDNQPNPFTDYAMWVTFTHPTGAAYRVPGYFAADGNAAETSARSGNIWRAHFAPDRTGVWAYQVTFRKGPQAALEPAATSLRSMVSVDGCDQVQGEIQIRDTDKTGRDFRAQGRLVYVGQRYLQHAASKRYFLKIGADSPETLLAYRDFDEDFGDRREKRHPLKSFQMHEPHWQAGDPVWQQSKGRGLIGAIRYLSGKGCNAFSFLTYNAGGDGDNVWPFVRRQDKLHFDCSKLDQWGIVFDFATQQGMYLHFKLQETENDDHIRGHQGKAGRVPESLDGGDLGIQRKLYLRELVARFGHELALNWNLGEENTQTTAQQQQMINYLHAIDPYHHLIVVHTFPDQQAKVYQPLMGNRSRLTGVSLQNSSIDRTHQDTLRWVKAAESSGRPWVVAFDESGTAAHGVCPDLGYQGYDGVDASGKRTYTEHEVRSRTLWGTLMAGGAGCEYYFGYKYVQNDLNCEDWTSRDRSWDYGRIAIEFFHDHSIPFWEMENCNELVENKTNDNRRYCLAKADGPFVIYLAPGQTGANWNLDLTKTPGRFEVRWFDPRRGGDLQVGSVAQVDGNQRVGLGLPNQAADNQEAGSQTAGKDWVILIRRLK